MKVALNKHYGGFGLSKEAYEFLGLEWDGYGYAFSDDEKRADKNLIKCIETLGSKRASGSLAKVCVVDIPDGMEYEIDDYDGYETLREQRPSW